jgi:hypothetical protein
MKTFEGKLVSKEIKIGIVAARFNEFITAKLLEGAMDGLLRHNMDEKDIHVAWVPGAFEIPLIASKMAKSRKYDAVIWFTIQTKPEILNYIVEKGSIAIDGISLTAAKIEKDSFSVSAIPHTVKQTILHERKEGSFVNLEADVIGKYIEKLLSISLKQQTSSLITKDFLTKYGF